jgi:hypothetical protein
VKENENSSLKVKEIRRVRRTPPNSDENIWGGRTFRYTEDEIGRARRA